jgi:hypothetical protein
MIKASKNLLSCFHVSVGLRVILKNDSLLLNSSLERSRVTFLGEKSLSWWTLLNIIKQKNEILANSLDFVIFEREWIIP